MTIVADTSALAAIVFAEPERQVFLDIITQAPRVLISPFYGATRRTIQRPRNK